MKNSLLRIFWGLVAIVSAVAMYTVLYQPDILVGGFKNDDIVAECPYAEAEPIDGAICDKLGQEQQTITITPTAVSPVVVQQQTVPGFGGK